MTDTRALLLEMCIFISFIKRLYYKLLRDALADIFWATRNLLCNTKMNKKFFILFITVLIICFLLLIVHLNNLVIPSKTVSLEYPLKNGTFLVAQGGKTWFAHKTPLEKYALDIVRFPVLSSLIRFRDASLGSDITFGTPIYSPCLGQVKIVKDGVPDQPIGLKDPAEGSGNTVVIACDGFDVMMGHFKKNSIKVKPGDKLPAGETIGLIGNSGNTDGPHLHIMAYLVNDSTGGKTPLPITFNGRYLRTFDSFTN